MKEKLRFWPILILGRATKVPQKLWNCSTIPGRWKEDVDTTHLVSGINNKIHSIVVNPLWQFIEAEWCYCFSKHTQHSSPLYSHRRLFNIRDWWQSPTNRDYPLRTIIIINGRLLLRRSLLRACLSCQSNRDHHRDVSCLRSSRHCGPAVVGQSRLLRWETVVLLWFYNENKWKIITR